MKMFPCVNRNCSVCVNTIPVVRAVTSVVLVTTSSHGNQEPFPKETHVKVRKWTEKTNQKNCRGYCKVVFTIPCCLSSVCLSSVCLSPLLLLPVYFSPVCLSECNCHNKALDCFYNQTIADLFQSLNTRGLHQGGGVCINCQQNTAGINCETCRDGLYRPAEVRTNTANNNTPVFCPSITSPLIW